MIHDYSGFLSYQLPSFCIQVVQICIDTQLIISCQSQNSNPFISWTRLTFLRDAESSSGVVVAVSFRSVRGEHVCGRNARPLVIVMMGRRDVIRQYRTSFQMCLQDRLRARPSGHPGTSISRQANAHLYRTPVAHKSDHSFRKGSVRRRGARRMVRTTCVNWPARMSCRIYHRVPSRAKHSGRRGSITRTRWNASRSRTAGVDRLVRSPLRPNAQINVRYNVIGG